MPRRRIIRTSGGCYHTVSRICENRWYFGRGEKEFFVSTLRRLEAFLDVKVLTFCVMSNHFHLLLEVPGPGEVVQLTPELLRKRLALLYRSEALAAAQEEIDRALEFAASPNGSTSWIDEILARHQARMGNLSVFLKELKWRFSRWYNSCNDRIGALWVDRFRSVLVEGDENALMTVAAYIELNPVRAQIVADPKDYRWSGYGEAVAGQRRARRNLARMHSRMRCWQGGGKAPVTWREVGAAYRRYLFGQGERRLGDGITGRGAKTGLDVEHVAEVVEKEAGQLSLSQTLRCRVRYFTEGAVIGGASFLEEVLDEFEDQFSKRRANTVRSMARAAGGASELSALRVPRNSNSSAAISASSPPTKAADAS